MTYYNYLNQPMPQSGASTSQFWGTSATETLNGTAGNDTIGSNGGGDTLVGGAGDDLYYVQAGDKVVEQANGGTDTATVWTNYILPDNVENLLLNNPSTYGVGNAQANLIVGGTGAQTIDGKAGNDVLVAGTGQTTFIAAVGEGNDTVYGFKTGAGGDIVRLDGGSLHTFDQVKAAMTQVGADVVIKIDATETLTLRNTQVGQLTADNFHLPLDYSKLGAMTFDDEFNSLHLFDGKSGWKTNYGYNGTGEGSYTLPGNGEQEVYVAPGFQGTAGHDLGLNPYSDNNGVLTISANPTPSNLLGSVWNQPYTSGMISTNGVFSQKYGYFEMKAELPSGKGLWPAFWLLPQDGSWPPELDVMEQLGNDTNSIYTTAHSQASGTHTADGAQVYTGDMSNGFHTFGVNWTPTTLTWYVDGNEVYQTNTPADMQKEMYLIANLAVGGGWPGSPDGSTHFPAQMQIDYIRAYAYDPTGTGSGGSTTPTSPPPVSPPPVSPPPVSPPPVSPPPVSPPPVSPPASGDTVTSSTTYSLWNDATTHNLTLTGTANINGTGNTLDNIILGNDGANSLDGAAGNDTLDGGKGDDTLTGGPGSDTFRIDVGGGHDYVTDFTLSDHDRIDFTDLANHGYAPTITQNGVDTLITFGSGDSITLLHTTASSLTVDGDYIVAAGSTTPPVSPPPVSPPPVSPPPPPPPPPASGDTVSSSTSASLANSSAHNLTLTGTANIDGTGNALDNTILGNAGVNHLSGGAGNDFLDGGKGDDFLIGGAGKDTFKLGVGGGHDTVTDFHVTGPSADRIDISDQLAHGYTAHITQVGTDVLISFGGGDSITLQHVHASQLHVSGNYII